VTSKVCTFCGNPIAQRLLPNSRRYCSARCRNHARDQRKDLPAEVIEQRFQQAKAQQLYERRKASVDPGRA
jgi:predicted nucleic acid-binding Zn ribbon protein